MAALAGVLLSLGAVAHSHQLRAAMTQVLFNDHTQRIEVNHRFYAHDAEQVVTSLLGPGADVLGSAQDRYRFGIYVHERFALFNGAGEPLELELRGVELDGDFLWVYAARSYSSQPPAGLQVDNRALRDIWPDQVNTVNIEFQGRVQTLTFFGAAHRLAVELP